MSKLLLLALVAALVLVVAVPAFASHDPNATGCELAHECFADVAKWYPPGWPEVWGSCGLYEPLEE